MSPLGLIVIYQLKVRVFFNGNQGILGLVGGGCLQKAFFHEVLNKSGPSQFALSLRKLVAEHGVNGAND